MTGAFRFARFSVLSGLFASAIGIAVLIGWAIDNPSLKAVNPDFISMKPNTALCLALLGLELFLNQGFPESQKVQWTTHLWAVLVVTLGVISLSEYALGVDWGIDQLLFSETEGTPRTIHPGRMAPTTAVTFVALGLALLLHGSRSGPKAAQIGGMIGVAVSLSVLVGYACQVESLQGIAANTPMAVHTAIAFLSLSLGVLFRHPDYGVVGLLRRPKP